MKARVVALLTSTALLAGVPAAMPAATLAAPSHRAPIGVPVVRRPTKGGALEGCGLGVRGSRPLGHGVGACLTWPRLDPPATICYNVPRMLDRPQNASRVAGCPGGDGFYGDRWYAWRFS